MDETAALGKKRRRIRGLNFFCKAMILFTIVYMVGIISMSYYHGKRRWRGGVGAESPYHSPTDWLWRLSSHHFEHPPKKNVSTCSLKGEMKYILVQVAEARNVGLLEAGQRLSQSDLGKVGADFLEPLLGTESEATERNLPVTVDLNVHDILGRIWLSEAVPSNIACDVPCHRKHLRQSVKDYERGEKEWYTTAAASVKEVNQLLLNSTRAGKQWAVFGEKVSAREYVKAALTASTFYDDTTQNLISGVIRPAWSQEEESFKEPRNAVMVMYNARFWFFGAVHDCNVLVTSGCWGKLRAYHVEADPLECMSNSTLPRYSKVAMVSSKKSIPYYHFFMEILPRIALILPVLREDPSIQIVLDTSVTKGNLPHWIPELLDLLHISTDRLLEPQKRINGGCADVLLLPEPTSCLGPTFAQLHVLRSALIAGLAFTNHLPDKTAASTQKSVVLVYRSPHLKRHIKNSYEVQIALQETLVGTNIIVQTGREPLWMQLKTFVEAKGVVAPHGAALSHLVVMQRGAAVVEYLADGDDIVLLYMMIAFKMELRYRGIVTKGATHKGSWTVDANEAAVTMSLLLSQDSVTADDK